MKNIVDIVKGYIPLSNVGKLGEIIKESYLAVTDYQDGRHYGALTDLTSISALTHIHRKMIDDQTGSWILKNKPRITNQMLQQLQNCQEGTFGKTYYNYMMKNKFKPSQRPLVRYIPDIELAYISQRYKQIHDFLHILLLNQINVHNELLIKWFEMIQLGFPSATLAVMSSPLLSSNLQIQEIAAICRKANRHRFVMNIYFQDHFNKNLVLFYVKQQAFKQQLLT